MTEDELEQAHDIFVLTVDRGYSEMKPVQDMTPEHALILTLEDATVAMRAMRAREEEAARKKAEAEERAHAQEEEQKAAEEAAAAAMRARQEEEAERVSIPFSPREVLRSAVCVCVCVCVWKLSRH
jgi:hypothetical protein